MSSKNAKFFWILSVVSKMLLNNPSQAPDHRMWKSENDVGAELYSIKKMFIELDQYMYKKSF